jgi:glycine cleavage system transcriptional repressor
MDKIVVGIFGRDRPGIVCKVASILAEHNCNIEDISQTVLQGEFCGMFVVSLGEGLTMEALQNILDKELISERLKVFTKELELGEGLESAENESFVVVSIGRDRVGLIAAISCIMYEFGVNISNLKFINRTPAFPDKTLTIYEVDVPKDIKLSDFVSKLKKKASELDLDISVQHKKIFEDICRI